MEIKINKFQKTDKNEVIDMMRVFYNSDAVYTNGSEEIFINNFENCIKNSPYVEGYTFKNKDNVLGYAMISKSYSTEFSKKCIWLEDLYIKQEYRGNGIIPKFIEYIEDKYQNNIFRLEVETYNLHAIHVYKKSGFSVLPYQEMIKLK